MKSKHNLERPSRVHGIRYYFQSNGIAILLFLALSALAIYPVFTQMDKAILGWSGDNVQYVYMVGWISKAIFSLQSPFVDPQLNFPDGLELAATDVPFGLMFAVAPVSKLVGPIFAYNFLILLNYFFSGYFTYLWIRDKTKSRSAGIIAGLIFTLIPYRVTHSYGHLQLIATAFIPLFFWYLDRMLDFDQPSIPGLIKLGLSIFLIGFCASQYYLLISMLFGFIYVILTKPGFGFLIRQGWKYGFSMVIGALLSTIPYIQARGDALVKPYEIVHTRPWSASLSDFIIPSRLHPVWGSLVSSTFRQATWIEHTLYLGLVACVLALVAVHFDRDNRRRNYRWLAMILISLVLALGTDLHIHDGQPLQEQPSIWFPAYYLGQLPGFNFMRVWARFSIIAMLFLSLLGGIGAKVIGDRFCKRGNLIYFLLAAAIVIDFMPGRLESTKLTLRPIDRWLAQQPGEFAVAFLPPFYGNSQSLFGSLFHNKSLPAFNHPNHLQAAYQSFILKVKPFPQSSSLKALESDGYRYLIFYREAFDGDPKPPWEEIEVLLQESNLVRKIAEINGTVVYEFISYNK